MVKLEDALLRVVRVCDRERELDAFMQRNGHTNNIHFNNWAELADVIMFMIGEQTDMFPDSMTCLVLTTQLPAKSKARMLMKEYQKNQENVGCQAPIFFDREETREMVQKNGGYMVQEAERPE